MATACVPLPRTFYQAGIIPLGHQPKPCDWLDPPACIALADVDLACDEPGPLARAAGFIHQFNYNGPHGPRRCWAVLVEVTDEPDTAEQSGHSLAVRRQRYHLAGNMAELLRSTRLAKGGA